MHGRLEIGLAKRKIDDVAAFRRKFLCRHRNRHARRRLYARGAPVFERHPQFFLALMKFRGRLGIASPGLREDHLATT